VTPSTLAQLSYDELLDWVRNRLQGRDLSSAGSGHDDLDMPHFLIASLYSRVDHAARVNLQEIVVDFIRDLARNPSSEWRSSAGGELLMLADPILLDRVATHGKAEIGENLRKIADAAPLNSNLRFRALQAIVTVRCREHRDYWISQYRAGGDAYLPIVLEGLANLDVKEPFEWLVGLEWTDDLERAVSALLPGLLDEYGSGSVTSVLSGILKRLSKPGAEAIRRFCLEERITLPASGYSASRNIWEQDHSITVTAEPLPRKAPGSHGFAPTPVAQQARPLGVSSLSQ